MGFFLPQNADQSLAALEMMDFEGIEKVRERISQNGTLLQMVQQLQQQMMQMATILDTQNGTTIGASMAQAFGLQAEQQGTQESAALGTASDTSETDALGDATAKTQRLSAAGARTKAASSAMPQ